MLFHSTKFHSGSLAILLLFMAFICFSCSSDDDNPSAETNPQEAVIGTWKLRDRTEIGIEYCELKTSYTFSEDQSMLWDYHYGDAPEDCDSTSPEGHWELLENNRIVLNYPSIESQDTLKISLDGNT